MIDSNGKKIINDKEKVDLDFLLAEIKFFLKGFRISTSDEKALNIAKSINEFLKAEGSPICVTNIVLELEEYSTETRSDDFMWQLVYNRRTLSECFFRRDNKPYGADCRYIAAQHFEKICELTPSAYNKHCRILEYVIATNDYSKANMKFKNNAILTHAEQLFVELEDSVNENYFMVATHLYYNLFVDYKDVQNDPERAYESIKRCVNYAWRMHRHRNSMGNLQRLSLYYWYYMHCKQYSVAAEEERLRTLIDLMSNYEDGNYLIRSRISTFRDVLENFEKTKKQ